VTERPRSLAVKERQSAWCAVCRTRLAEGAVYCPEHPEAEVYLLLVANEPDPLQELPVDLLFMYWGKSHVTDDRPCWCLPAYKDGLVIHRLMPWDRLRHRGGEA
jgi:hypothetical protein